MAGKNPISKALGYPNHVIRKNLEPEEVRKYQMYKEKDKSSRIAIDILLGLFVRVCFILEIVFAIYYMVGHKKDSSFFAMITGGAIILLDGIYVVFRRKGRSILEKPHLTIFITKRFSITLFCYSIAFLVPFWVLFSDAYRKDRGCDKKCDTYGSYNKTQDKSYDDKPDFWLSAYFTNCGKAELFLSAYLITLMIAKWLLPIKQRLSREAVSTMLLEYIANGADIAEFYANVQKVLSYQNFSLVFAIIVFISISSLQFCFTTAAKRRKRIGDTKFNVCMDIIFGTEIWAIILIFSLQDFPFLILRIILVINYKTADQFTIYFFAAKNVLLCFTQIYKIIIILKEHTEHDSHVHPHDKNNKDYDDSKDFPDRTYF